jgi:hypothetical protein
MSVAEATAPREAVRSRVWTEPVIARLALGVIALHVVDDNFLQPEPGTSGADHLVSGLVPMALLALIAAAYGRARAGYGAHWRSSPAFSASSAEPSRRTTRTAGRRPGTTSRGSWRWSAASPCSASAP